MYYLFRYCDKSLPLPLARYYIPVFFFYNYCPFKCITGPRTLAVPRIIFIRSFWKISFSGLISYSEGKHHNLHYAMLRASRYLSPFPRNKSVWSTQVQFQIYILY